MTITPLKRAVGYCRQSKSRNEYDGDSLSTSMQEYQIREYAQRNGIEVVRVYSDQDFTGRTDKRPAFQEMFAAIRAKHDPVSAVITYKFARFARKVRVFATYHGELQDRGVELLSVTESSDTRMVQMSAMMADWYSTDLSEFTSAAIRHKIRSGRWHGNIPVGYRKDAASQCLVPDPGESVFVAELFDRYTGGESIVSLLGWIHNDPALAPIREGRVWNRTTIHRILGRRAYLGHTSGMEDAHPAIIDRAVWDLTQRLRERPQRRTHAKAIGSPLEGMLTCGACGQPMRLHMVPRRDKPGVQPRFWKCASFGRQYDYGETVTPHQRTYRADWIEDATRRAIRDDLVDVVPLDRALARARRAVSSEGADRRRTALARERAKVEAGRDRVLTLFRDGRLDADRWETSDRESAAILARIDTDLAGVPVSPDPGQYAAAERVLADVRAILIATDRPDLEARQDAELRRLLIALDVRIAVDARPVMRGRARTAPSVTITYGAAYRDFLGP